MAVNEWIRFTFAVDGVSVFNRKVMAPAGVVKTLAPAWELIALDFWETEKKVFEAEGAYEGLSGWQAWSESYALERGGGKILVKTGDLRASLTGGAQSIKKVTDTSLEIGSGYRVGKWNLAVIHQYGSRISKRNLAARPVIRLTDKQKNRWSRIMAQYVRRMIREAAQQ